MYRKEKFWIGLWILLLVVSIGTLIFSIVDWNGIVILISSVSWLTFIFSTIPFVYWGLAPLNIFFTFVDEGTSKIVVKGGKFSRALIQWEGQTFDEYWNVIPEGWYENGVLLDVESVINEKKGRVRVIDKEKKEGPNISEKNAKQRKEKHLFGGLRFYGIWPILDIYGYLFRWTSIRQDGEPVQHEGILESILLKDLVYFADIREAEEKDKIPLDIDLLITLRVVNPYKALFKVQDWLELVLNRIKPLFREHVANYTYQELLVEKQKAGGELWKKLKAEGLIDEFKKDYGIEVKEGGIEMKDIAPPPEYQKAATQKYLAEREAEKEAGETMGAVIQMLAISQGEKPDDIRKQINTDPELKKELRLFCQDLIHRKMALDKNSYLDIRVSGAEGTEKSLLELISAWRRMPGTGTKT